MIKRFNIFFCVFVVIFISFIFSSTLLLAQEKGAGREIGKIKRQLKQLIQQKRSEGMDTSEAIQLDIQSKEAMRQGRSDKCLKLLREAIALLEESGTTKKNKATSIVSAMAYAPGVYEDSPFGITESIRPIQEYADMNSLGVRWSRQGGIQGLSWKMYLKQGDAYWRRYDKLFSEAEKKGIKLNVIIRIQKLPEDMNAYKEFLRQAVRRYLNIDVWELHQELENEWKDTLENYAFLLKESYKVIKQANTNAKVAFAAMAGPWEIQKTLVPIIDKLNKIADSPEDTYFDIVSFHWSGKSEGNNYKKEVYAKAFYLDDAINEFTVVLEARGYNNIPVWISATSYNDGQPTFKLSLNPRTEKQQAAELFKMYVYSLAKGVSKIFWVAIMEHRNAFKFVHQEGVDYYNLTGLINNPKNKDGKDWKKLAYYTYKKMTEVLEGSDWGNIQTIQEEDGIYIYKFLKDDKSIWVAWNDNREPKSVQLMLDGTTKNVKITEAVPRYELGKEVKDYNAAFREIRYDKIDSYPLQIKFELGESPVYVQGNNRARH